ncbi:mitochondrial folate transporter/carrier [Trifolium pratense]|uniref:Mitochondrial folate transporter/carrier n=1 Tax=Trifolium pratense TaxID=57577 RepID=A0A2K3P3Z6_TRIPR|nr:mitochondrial folate transporter/carrier [Trifolium pratense]
MEATKRREKLQWEYPVASLASKFTFITISYPLDLVQTRLKVNDGRLFSQIPRYNNTAHAIFTIARLEGLKGLYTGFHSWALGITISTGLVVLYGSVKAKQIHDMSSEEMFFAGALLCLCTNPIVVVKTRLQLQTPLHQARPYSGLYDAFMTIKREEGFSALFRGIVPGLFVVSYIAIHVTVYEELRKTIVNLKTKGSKIQHQNPDQILNSVDFAVLGATTKVAAKLPTYPFNVIRTRLQQRPDGDGIPRYRNSWHVVKETARFEGVRGFYKGITPNLLISIPVVSMTSIVYENVLKLLKLAKRND